MVKKHIKRGILMNLPKWTYKGSDWEYTDIKDVYGVIYQLTFEDATVRIGYMCLLRRRKVKTNVREEADVVRKIRLNRHQLKARGLGNIVFYDEQYLKFKYSPKRSKIHPIGEDEEKVICKREVIALCYSNDDMKLKYQKELEKRKQ